jgi:hypothetical protein
MKKTEKADTLPGLFSDDEVAGASDDRPGKTVNYGRRPSQGRRRGYGREPMDYDTLMGQYGKGAKKTLRAALATGGDQGSAGGIGPLALFINALFCLLEREYRAKPNKKKALLLWELFLAGAYNNPINLVLFPDARKHTNVLCRLEMSNLDGADPNAASSKEISVISTATDVIRGEYETSRKKGHSGAFSTTKKARQMDALNLGVVHTQLFQSVVNKLKPSLQNIDEGAVDIDIYTTACKELWQNRTSLATALKKAGFEPGNVGLS